jgi:hypothetical protein
VKEGRSRKKTHERNRRKKKHTVTAEEKNVMNTLVFSNLSKPVQRKYLQINHETMLRYTCLKEQVGQ